jgi:hypothetical protein
MNLKNTNWLAVAVELLVVIVGVYGAFQLQNWGDELRENQREKLLLEQLHNELEFATPLMEQQAENRRNHVDNATKVAVILMQPAGSGELTDEQCDEIFAISILGWNPLSLTTLDEMVSSGVHSQLDDRELRALLFSLQAEMRSLGIYMQLLRGQQNLLMDQYPDLLPRGVDANGEAFMRCDTEGMRASQAFINHLMSNIGRYGGMTDSLEEQLDALRKVHIKLDEVLRKTGTEKNTLHEEAKPETRE